MAVGLISLTAPPIVPNRIVLVVYGQSNADVFGQAGTGVVALPGTSFWNGTTLTAAADGLNGAGIITCMNAIKTATGLPVVYQDTAGGGQAIANLADPTSAFYINTVTFARALILPTDAVYILWGQGEGDANAAGFENEQTYLEALSSLHQSLVTDISRSKANTPFITYGLGTAGVSSPAPVPTGGNSQRAWHTIQTAQFNSQIFNPYMYFSHTNIDLNRTDGYHYTADATGTIKMGQRFGRAVTTLYGSTTGFAHWEITGGTTVSATQTDLTVQHGIGTDFTPTSGGQGFEVSGNNGASWDSTATAARQNATTIRLTHPSISTTKARAIRYQYGFFPPSMSAFCGIDHSCAGPVNAIFDNSTISVPLSPTTWDIRPTTATAAIPVPTWRGKGTGPSNNHVAPYSQITTVMQLGPPTDNYQKFAVLAIYSGNVTTPATVQIRPNVGGAVNATFVAQHATKGLYIYQAALGADNIGATNCTVYIDFPSDPFGGYGVQIWTTPLADLTSTTVVGTQNTTTPASTTGSCTVTTAAGGFVIAVQFNDQSNSPPITTFSTYSSNYVNRWDDPNLLWLDASNIAGTTDTLTVTNQLASTVNILMASWR